MIALTLFILALIAMPLKGWIASLMWGWFVIPVFHLPALSVPVATGIALLVSYLTHFDVNCEEPKRTDSEKLGRAIAHLFVAPFIVLFVAWIIHLFC